MGTSGSKLTTSVSCNAAEISRKKSIEQGRG